VSGRIVPTSPGWWWHQKHGVVWVDTYRDGLCFETVDGSVVYRFDVLEDGAFLAPVATPEQVAALTAERDDLAAELAAARGEDIGEWECGGDYYAPRDSDDGVRPIVGRHVDGVRWLSCVDDHGATLWRGEPTGVLAAMRAAFEAARGFGWAP
jgi:hypothetical protein